MRISRKKWMSAREGSQLKSAVLPLSPLSTSHSAPSLHGIRRAQSLWYQNMALTMTKAGCTDCCIHCVLERTHCNQTSSSPPNITLYVSFFFIVWQPLNFCCDPWKVPVTVGWMNEWMNEIKKAHWEPPAFCIIFKKKFLQHQLLSFIVIRSLQILFYLLPSEDGGWVSCSLWLLRALRLIVVYFLPTLVMIAGLSREKDL